MRRDVLLILGGSLKQQLRDPLTLLAMLVIPVLLNPLALWVTGKLQTRQAEALRGATLTVEAPAELQAWVRPRDRLELVQQGWGDEEHPEVQAQIRLLAEGGAEVRHRSTDKRSVRAGKRASRVLRRMRQDEMDGRFEEAGLGLEYGKVCSLEKLDLATDEEREGGLLGRLLPLVLIFVVLNGATLSALDALTGERERGTLETLLAARVERGAVLLGKFLLVLGISLCSGLLAVLSLWAFLALGLYEAPTGGMQIPIGALPVLGMLLLPLCVLVAALMSVVAAYVPDYRSGQFASVGLMFLALAAAAVSAFPTISFSPALALLPISNVAMAMREALLGRFPVGLLCLAIVASAVHVALALGLGLRLMRREAVLLGAPGAVERRARGLFVPDALGIFLLALLLLWFLGQRVQSMHLLGGLVFTQVVLVAGLALGALWRLGLPLAETLQLRAPRGRDLGLALLAGLGAPAISALAAAAQQPLLPVSTRFMESLEGALTVDAPLWVLLAVFALAPAVCEELLFRGTLLGLLRRSLGPVGACLLVGAMFGAIHLHLVRLLPTATFGAVLAAAALRSRSLLVPVLMHLLHNGFLLLAQQRQWFPDGDPPLALLLGMAALSLGALWAMGRGGDRPPSAALSRAA